MPKVWKWRHIVITSVLVFFVLLAVERLVIWPLIMGQTLETALNDAPESPEAASSTAGDTASRAEVPASYTAQLGAFSSETLAKHFSQQLELQGIEAKIYYSEGRTNAKPRFVVISGTFGTSDEATQLVTKAQSVSNIVSETSVLRTDQVKGDCIQGCD